MKSRFDALSSPADRLRLAMFRSSGAVGLVLLLLTLSAVTTAERSTREPVHGNLFAIELGIPQTVPSESVATTEVPGQAAERMTAAPAARAEDEFALPSGPASESLSY